MFKRECFLFPHFNQTILDSLSENNSSNTYIRWKFQKSQANLYVGNYKQVLPLVLSICISESIE